MLGKLSMLPVIAMKELFINIKQRLQKLSFRTGVIVLLLCIPFYILSFAQMALPLDIGLKSTLWAILFGLAKTFQYSGITILGAKGIQRFKEWFRKNKSIKSSDIEIN